MIIGTKAEFEQLADFILRDYLGNTYDGYDPLDIQAFAKDYLVEVIIEFWNNGYYPWISIADIQADTITSSAKELISKEALKECFAGKVSPAGTMIMSFKLTIGKISILGFNAVHNEAIISIFPTVERNDEAIIKSYLFKILPLIAVKGDFKNAVKGKTLNATAISNLMIPLPPLAEQERIVARIEELMPLVEEYGKAEEQLRNAEPAIGRCLEAP